MAEPTVLWTLEYRSNDSDSNNCGVFSSLEKVEEWIGKHAHDYDRAERHYWFCGHTVHVDDMQDLPYMGRLYFWTKDGRRWEHQQPTTAERAANPDLYDRIEEE